MVTTSLSTTNDQFLPSFLFPFVGIHAALYAAAHYHALRCTALTMHPRSQCAARNLPVALCQPSYRYSTLLKKVGWVLCCGLLERGIVRFWVGGITVGEVVVET